MNGVFHIGATGLHAQDRALRVVANNITNLNTQGFKRGQVRFSALVGAAPSVLLDGSAPAGLTSPPGFGVSASGAERVFLPGEMRPTGNPLDLAIAGDGFIELSGPSGQTLLWRGGTLSVSPDGFLAGANGLPLKAMISVPDGATALSIDAAGEVRALLPGETEARSIGRIDLVMVRNMPGLQDVEGGLYRPADEVDLVSGEAGVEAGTFVQGSLEMSNVALNEEMVALLMMQRAYAASAQVVQAGDQLMGIANGLKR